MRRLGTRCALVGLVMVLAGCGSGDVAHHDDPTTTVSEGPSVSQPALARVTSNRHHSL